MTKHYLIHLNFEISTHVYSLYTYMYFMYFIIGRRYEEDLWSKLIIWNFLELITMFKNTEESCFLFIKNIKTFENEINFHTSPRVFSHQVTPSTTYVYTRHYVVDTRDIIIFEVLFLFYLLSIRDLISIKPRVIGTFVWGHYVVSFF